jgi:hypothetical protein
MFSPGDLHISWLLAIAAPLRRGSLGITWIWGKSWSSRKVQGHFEISMAFLRRGAPKNGRRIWLNEALLVNSG